MTNDAVVVRRPDGRSGETAGAQCFNAAFIKGEFPSPMASAHRDDT